MDGPALRKVYEKEMDKMQKSASKFFDQIFKKNPEIHEDAAFALYASIEGSFRLGFAEAVARARYKKREEAKRANNKKKE